MLDIYFSAPEVSSIRYATVSGFLLSRLVRLICVFKFSPVFSLSVCSFSASSSAGFVRIGTYLPSFLDVSYMIGVPVSSGISSSSSSSSSSSVSLSARFLFWTIFSLLFRMSRRISSHRPYFPSSPRRQCRFFCLFLRLCLMPVLFCSSLKEWSRIKFSINYFSGVRFYSTFGSAYSGLDFVLEFSFL